MLQADLVIIGNGIAGVTTARLVRKRSDRSILIISDETPHFFSRTALMYAYMGHMPPEDLKPYEDWFWQKNRLELLQARVERLDTAHGKVILQDGRQVNYADLVIATGSKPRFMEVEGIRSNGVQGLYHWQDLEKLEAMTPHISKAVVVGGGLIGVELSEMLCSRGKQVTMLVREDGYWGDVLPKQEAAMIGAHLVRHGVELRFSTQLDSIRSDSKGNVTSLTTDKGDVLDCQMVGVSIGVEPNVAFLQDSGLELDRGVMVDEFLRTNVSNVFAAGDCVQHRAVLPHRKAIEQVWYTGRLMGETLSKNLTGEPTAYRPGPWFNSAKFFDIEYQTYGQVPKEIPSGSDSFLWQDVAASRSLRVVWRKSDGRLEGVLTLGWRLRHELMDSWLRSGKGVDHFMTHLREVDFEPEFSADRTDKVLSAFNSLTGMGIRPASKKWWKDLVG